MWPIFVGISFRPPSNGSLPAGYVEEWVEKLTPTMTSLDSLGLLNKSYVYGFDEMPEIYNESVYEIFGGLKKKWPALTTMVSDIDGALWLSSTMIAAASHWLSNHSTY